jgi:GntR family transcriptional regulator
MPLQRQSPDPLYIQVKEVMLDEIISGQYRPHDRLPSERELSTRFDVSRMTVRQALLDLVRDGAIYARVGKGTFVAAPKIDQQLRTLTSFSQDVRSRGGEPTSRVLEARETVASPEVAAALRLATGAPVLVLSRLRLADGVPLAIETTNLPLALCPDLFHDHNFAVESLYQVLRSDYGIEPAQGEQVIEAGLASPREVEVALHGTGG